MPSGMLFTMVDRLASEKKEDRDLLEEMTKTVVAVEGVEFKRTGDIEPFLHIVFRCEKCDRVLFTHSPATGDREFIHAVVAYLPKIVTTLLKNIKCDKHGKCRYVGYIFSSLCRQRKLGEEPPEAFDDYMVVVVSTKESFGKVYKTSKEREFLQEEVMVIDDGVKGAMVNIFKITHWDTDDPAFR